MIRPYHSILSYSGEFWREFLESIYLLDIFSDLLEEFNDPEKFTRVIHYILYTYSIASDRIISGMDTEKNKKSNFSYCRLAEDEWQQIGMLQSPAVLKAVMGWLKYQDQEVFTQLSLLKDLKTEMQISSVSTIKKSSGEIDFDQKFKCATYALDLRRMIRDLENELLQNSPALAELVKEVKAVKKAQVTGIELFIPH